MPYNPSRHAKVFGSSFVKDFNERVMLTVGKDTWTRADLIRMGICQTKACSILSYIAKQIGATSLKEMFINTSPYTFASYPAGMTTLCVLFAAFYDRDLDASKWYKSSENAAMVSFATLKEREHKARAKEREEEKQRSRRARRTKHEAGVRRVLATAS